MISCESCNRRPVNGDKLRFAQDDPEPGSGFVLCEDCWDEAEREKLEQLEQEESPKPIERPEPPEKIIARSVRPGDQINVGGRWETVTSRKVTGNHTVRIYWGEDKSIELYTDDKVSIRLKEFTYS